MGEEFAGIGYGRGALSPYATDAAKSRGRFHDERSSPTRTDFQRDRDRIIHSTAFRRLKHKTQVFFSHEDDHYRTRLTHTIEVAQIARALARAFRLDEDLAEAIALVHDFGHTPFGHTGEDVLHELMAAHGGFDHNAQALRVVTKLERRYAEFDGLNLTFETLEGLVKHNGPLTGPHARPEPVPATILHYCELHDLELSRHASLEAQVAAIADDIAYNTHDIDDGLRSGLLTHDQLSDVALAGKQLAVVDGLYPGLDSSRRTHEMTRRVMTVMVEDVIRETTRRIEQLRPQSVEDVHDCGQTLVGFSDAMAAQEKAFKAFMFKNLYRHPDVVTVRKQAEQVVRDLFGAYMADPQQMGGDWSHQLTMLDEPRLARRVADYLAGMTDTYALKQHQRLFDHTPELR